jgi:excisionase family DNA binding protein
MKYHLALDDLFNPRLETAKNGNPRGAMPSRDTQRQELSPLADDHVANGVQSAVAVNDSRSGTPKIYAIPQVAEIAQVSEQTVRDAIALGQLPARRFSQRVTRITEDDVQAWLSNTRLELM